MDEIQASLFRLRIAACYLGEKSQFSWWQSDFFGGTAASFLGPTFPRTQLLAQTEGATAAARLLHDERIGVGRVFHLFRLPEDLEQLFHQRLQDTNVADELSEIISDKTAALKFMESEFGKPTSQGVGPISLGDIAEITTKPTVDLIGQAYLAGFQNETPVFPFLKEG